MNALTIVSAYSCIGNQYMFGHPGCIFCSEFKKNYSFLTTTCIGIKPSLVLLIASKHTWGRVAVSTLASHEIGKVNLNHLHFSLPWQCDTHTTLHWCSPKDIIAEAKFRQNTQVKITISNLIFLKENTFESS